MEESQVKEINGSIIIVTTVIFLGVFIAIGILMFIKAKEIKITDIQVSWEENILYYKENSSNDYSIEAQIFPKDYTEKVIYRSSNEKVLTIENDGKYKLNGLGEADIIIQSESETVEKRVHIIVKEYIPATSWNLDTEDFEMKLGETKIIQVNYEPSNATKDLILFNTIFSFEMPIGIENIDFHSVKVIAKKKGCGYVEATNLSDDSSTRKIKICVEPEKELKIEDEKELSDGKFMGKICNRTNRNFVNLNVMYPLYKTKYSEIGTFSMDTRESLKLGECWLFMTKPKDNGTYEYYKSADIIARDENKNLFMFPDPLEINDWEE